MVEKFPLAELIQEKIILFKLKYVTEKNFCRTEYLIGWSMVIKALTQLLLELMIDVHITYIVNIFRIL